MNIMSSYNEEVVVLGDFNFHLECIADKDAEKQLCRVQSLINTTARLITGTRKFDHITPVLKSCIGSVRNRVVYKILLRIFKCRLGYCTKYISERLIPISKIPERQKLRSLDSTNL